MYLYYMPLGIYHNYHNYYTYYPYYIHYIHELLLVVLL